MKQSSKSQRGRRAATLADVGREAGVSAMAASVALNGAVNSSRVSDDTRTRVLAAAERLRYRPNATARGLAERRMHTLGLASVLGGDEPNLYFLEIFNGVIKGAAAAGQTVTVFTLDDWGQAAQRIPGFCDGRIDGLILVAPELSVDAVDWVPAHTPLVSVHSNQEIVGVANLESDDEGGALSIVSHMLGLGHRRILHVGGPTGALGADRRVCGYLRAYADAGLAPPPGHVLRDTFSAEGGRRAIEAWLGRHQGAPLPDAVFAASDAIAFGCIERLNARGLRVPADISVVGFDDTVLARTVHMATVRQPLHQLGRRAVEVLLERIGAHRSRTAVPTPCSLVLPTEMVPGVTLAAPRTAALTIA